MKTNAKIALGVAALLVVGVVGTKAYAHRDGARHGGGYHHGEGYHGKWHHRRGHGMRHRINRMMERYDANGDRKLTQEEINSNREAWVKEFDADNNGALSLQEFEKLWLKARRDRMVRAFQRFDNDGDANVTLDEYLKPLANLVENRDRNGDGALSREDRGRHHKHHRHHKGNEDSNTEN